MLRSVASILCGLLTDTDFVKRKNEAPSQRDGRGRKGGRGSVRVDQEWLKGGGTWDEEHEMGCKGK